MDEGYKRHWFWHKNSTLQCWYPGHWSIGSTFRPAKCVLTDNSLQTDMLRGGEGIAVSTKIFSMASEWRWHFCQCTAPSDVSHFVRSKGFRDCWEGTAAGRNQTQQLMGWKQGESSFFLPMLPLDSERTVISIKATRWWLRSSQKPLH